MSAQRLTWEQVRAWRARRHHLHERVPRKRALDVVSRLCGLHAQVMSSAELTLWARVDGLEPDAVAQALWEDRTLVKTWAMRGTLHLLPSAEYPLWQAALGTYRHFLKPSWSRAFGVTPEELDQLVTAVGEALDDKQLTRSELADAVGQRTSATLGDKLRESWGALLKPASFRGQLCFAPGTGQKVRFTRPQTWLEPGDPPDPDEAVREVARRFLSVSGPATREDFARWWAISPAQAAKRIAELGDEVAQVDVEGMTAWMLAQDAGEAAAGEPAGTVRLLPAFDQYVIAATLHAERLLPGDFKTRIHRPQGWISPVLAVDGRMDGVWRHERKGARVEVEIEPFGKLPARNRRAAEEEAERLASFVGGRLELRWASP